MRWFGLFTLCCVVAVAKGQTKDAQELTRLRQELADANREVEVLDEQLAQERQVAAQAQAAAAEAEKALEANALELAQTFAELGGHFEPPCDRSVWLQPEGVAQHNFKFATDSVRIADLGTKRTEDWCKSECLANPICVGMEYAKLGDQRCRLYSKCPTLLFDDNAPNHPMAGYFGYQTGCAHSIRAKVTKSPTMSPASFILTKQPTFATLTAAPKADQGTVTHDCPKSCLGGAGNVRQLACTECECAGCPATLFLSNCNGVVPAACTDIAGVSGDPFTYAKDGSKVQFWLPLHKDTKLLGCGDFTLYGSTKTSGTPGDNQQWFEQFRVVIDKEEKLRTWITTPTGNLTTMAVAMEGQRIQQPMEVAYDGFSIDVTQNKNTRIGRGFVEIVHFSRAGTTLEIKSALASKFRFEKMTTEMQLRYTHLDLGFQELNVTACNAGVLAEIWGNVPMTVATEAMLRPPMQQ